MPGAGLSDVACWRTPSDPDEFLLPSAGYSRYAARQIQVGAWAMKLVGIDGMSPAELNFEVQRGGKFVTYYYCISIIIMTFRRGSHIYFIKAGESPLSKGLPWTLLSLLFGWWGIPWGPIWTIQSIAVNFRGGKDVTAAVTNALSADSGAGAAAGR